MLLPFNFQLLCRSSANPDDNSAKPDDNSSNPDKINPADISKHVMGNLPKTGSIIEFIRKFKR